MADTQPYLALNDGNRIPQLGLGVWQVPNAEVTGVVKAALRCGYRSIDTAAAYRNEEGVGDAIRDQAVPRTELFITTKLWNKRHGFDEALRAFDESMAKLGLDVLDLYLIHWPVPAQNLYLDSWKAFIRLKEEGRVRSIGVSNFKIPHLERIIGETGVVPTVNQIELHPRFHQHDMTEFHKRHDIKTESWSPLGQGRVLRDETIAAIARKHGRTAAQVILRWHLEQGLIVIPKSVHEERIRENFAVFDFALDAEDRQRIGELNRADGRDGADPDTFALV